MNLIVNLKFCKNHLVIAQELVGYMEEVGRTEERRGKVL
jgi:hypothetical protein